MQSQTLTAVRIGNSRGERLPAPLLSHYRIGHAVIAKRAADGIQLRPKRDGRMPWTTPFVRPARSSAARVPRFPTLWTPSGDGLATVDR